MKLHFFRFEGRNPTQAEWAYYLNEYARLEAAGLEPNAIGDALGISRGSACRLRLLSREARI